MRGRFINVANGVRRTYAAAPASGARRSRPVFVFGGSAALGHGARDGNTVPSWLARVAEEHGDVYDVRNYAESGWVHWQGIAYLLEKLADDERPAAVIFYSGVNETLSASRWPDLRRPILDGDLYPTAMRETVMRQRPLARAWHYYRQNSALLHFLPGAGPSTSGSPLSHDALVERVVRDVASDKAAVEALGRHYGFATLFVWQLTVAEKATLTGQERLYAGWLPSAPGRKGPALDWWIMPGDLRDAYRAIGHRLASEKGVVDISHALDDVATTAFIDWMHSSEAANEHIARALYPLVAAQLGD